MKFEKLHQLVHSLSKGEKMRFSKSMKGKTQTDYYLLYSRILSHKQLKADTEAKIKGAKFSNSQKYYTYGEELARLLIWSQITLQHSDFPALEFAKRAYLFDLPELGSEVLAIEMQKRQEAEDYHLLRYIYSFLADFKRQFGKRIELPENIKPEVVILEQIRVETELLDIKANILSTRNLSIRQRELLLNKEVGRIQLSGDSRSNQNLKRKIMMCVAFLRGNYHEAFSWGEELIENLQKFPEKYPPAFIAREITIIAMNALIQRNRNRAINLAMRISALETDNPLEEKKLNLYRVHIETTIAVTFVDESLAFDCFDKLNIEMFRLDQTLTTHRYYIVGLTFFQNENYADAIKCFEIVRKNLAGSQKNYLWEPQMLCAIAYLELGDVDESERILRSVSRLTQDMGGEYSKLTIRIFKKYLKTTPFEKAEFLTESLSAIQTLLQDPDEKRNSLTFPFSHWLQAKLEGVSQKEIVTRLWVNAENRRPILMFG